MSESIKIILVDDHLLWRDSFSILLNTMPGISVVEVAAEGGELFDIIKKVQFDIVLLDIEMRIGIDGLKTLKMVKENSLDMKIIMMSSHYEKSLIGYCFENGARAYLTKNTDIDSVYASIVTVHKEGYYIENSKKITDKLVSELYQELHNKYELITKELEVLFLLCKGKAIKVIALDLDMSERTVQRHIESINRKTGAKSRGEMISFGIKNGIAW